MTDFLLIALTDPLLTSEATHAAVATESEVKTCLDPRDIARSVPRARAIMVDSSTARHVGALKPSVPIYFLAPDPGPIDYEAALACHASAAFILPTQSAEFLTALGRAEDRQPVAANGGNSVAVLGAVGGVGTSTLAAGLAQRLAPSFLIDCRPERGGLDLLVGLEETPGVRWPDLALGKGQTAAHAIRDVLPQTESGCAVLSGARSNVLETFSLRAGDITRLLEHIAATQPVVLDDPPTSQLAPALDHVVIVTAAEVRAAASAAGIAATLQAQSLPASLVLRHRGWSSLGADEVERLVGLPVVAEIPTLRRLAKATELTGLPATLPRPLSRAVDQVLAEVQARA